MEAGCSEGPDADTRGTKSFIARSGDSKYFKDFPTIETDDSPGVVRGIGDLAFDADGGKIVIMLTGYKSGSWYHQLGLFGYKETEGKYSAVLSAISDTQTKDGSAMSHSGRILRATKASSGKYEVIFSTSDGIYKWTVTAGTQANPEEGDIKRLFSVSNFVDASADALGGNKVAIVSGYNISIKDLSNTSAEGSSTRVARAEGSTLTKLIGAKVSLAGGMLSIATPYGAAYPFSIYTVPGSGAPTIAATCESCRFLDVNVFKTFPNFLLTSSMTSGVEIYSTSAQ